MIPVQLTFRNAVSTEKLEAEIRDRAQKLNLFYPPIMKCQVLIEGSARQQKKGYSFQIRIRLTLPGGEIVVNRAPTLRPEDREEGTERHRTEMETGRKHLEGAIKQAFDAARRQLQNYARRKRVDVKSHEPVHSARVIRLYPTEETGYIETPGGREIYFHGNSVINGRYKNLKVGTVVTFVEEAGEKGPQASTIRLITKAGSVAAVSSVRAKR